MKDILIITLVYRVYDNKINAITKFYFRRVYLAKGVLNYITNKTYDFISGGGRIIIRGGRLYDVIKCNAQYSNYK